MPTTALNIVRKYYPQVDSVVDAKRDVEIEVSDRDSKSSTKKAPNACALATACKREYDGAIISLSVGYLIKGNKAVRFKVPQRIAREIVSFDRHADFAPGVYQLYAPVGHQKMGPRMWPQPPKKRHTDTPRKRHHRTAGIRQL